MGRADVDRSRVGVLRRWSATAFTVVLVGFWSSQVSAQCVGDCDGNGTVTVSEIIIGVNIALGSQDVSACGAFASGGTVGITELVQGVNNVLNGCPLVCEPPCSDPYPYCGPDAGCWRQPCSTVCSGGDVCCGGEFPNCGPDGGCWSLPCSTVCSGGDICCGGDFPNCGPGGTCWNLPCTTICSGGDTCCAGDFPNCGPDGSCWSLPCATLCGDTCCQPGQRCLNNQTCSH